VEDLGGDLGEVPEEFSEWRLPEVTALVWLDRRARAMRGQQVGGGCEGAAGGWGGGGKSEGKGWGHPVQ
jgi:hypothetical protein